MPVPHPTPLPGPNVPKVVTSPDSIKLAELKERLGQIKLPKVELEEIKLADAVEALAALSRRDDLPIHGKTRGVKICLAENAEGGVVRDLVREEIPETPASQQIPGLEQPSLPLFGFELNPKISYSATNVSLADAVEAVARLSHRHVYLLADTVYLTKLEHAPALLERTYIMPPSWLKEVAEQQSKPKTQADQARGMHDYLEMIARREKSDPLSTPSSTISLREGKIIVRDTEAQHLIVSDEIEAGWREYYTSQKAKEQKPH